MLQTEREIAERSQTGLHLSTGWSIWCIIEFSLNANPFQRPHNVEAVDACVLTVRNNSCFLVNRKIWISTATLIYLAADRPKSEIDAAILVIKSKIGSYAVQITACVDTQIGN